MTTKEDIKRIMNTGDIYWSNQNKSFLIYYATEEEMVAHEDAAYANRNK